MYSKTNSNNSNWGTWNHEKEIARKLLAYKSQMVKKG